MSVSPVMWGHMMYPYTAASSSASKLANNLSILSPGTSFLIHTTPLKLTWSYMNLYLPCLKLSDPELSTDLSREYQGAPTGFLKKNLSDRGNLSQVAKIYGIKLRSRQTLCFPLCGKSWSTVGEN